MAPRLLILAASLLLVACDIPGMGNNAAEKAAREEADGKAVGSGCRHAVRSIEDCYNQNPDSNRAAVFAGWKEMDQYMRDNKIDGMPTAAPKLEAEAAKDKAPAEKSKAPADKAKAQEH